MNLRLPLRIAGIVLVVVGGVWVLQGVGILPGSFMSGQIQWAVYGAGERAGGHRLPGRVAPTGLTA